MHKIEPKQYKVGDQFISSGDKIRWEFYADHVVHADMDPAVDDAFKVAEESAHYNAKANQAFRYPLGAVLALAIAGLIEGGLVYLVGLTAQTRPILLAALAGGVGAVVSVLQRISSLEISPFAHSGTRVFRVWHESSWACYLACSFR